MYKLTLLLVLVVATIGLKKITRSSTNTKIITPSSANTVYPIKLNSHSTYKNVIPGVKWIWDNNGLNTPKYDRIVVEIKLRAECRGKMTFSIAAYGNWFVYLDGKKIK